MLHGEHRGTGPVGDVELRVDVLEVGTHRLRANTQLPGDALVGQSLREEGQHLALSFAQVAGSAVAPASGGPSNAIVRRPRGDVAGRREHSLGRVAVESARSHVGAKLGQQVGLSQRASVWPVLSHGVIASAAASTRAATVSEDPVTPWW